MAKEISIELQKVEVPLEAKVKTESVLKNYQVLSLPELNFTELVKEMQAPVLLKLRFPDQEFTINLEPNDVKSIDYQSFLNGKELNEDEVKEITTFKGTVSNKGLEVRLSIFKNSIRGYIQLGESKLFIDRLSKVIASKEPNDTLISYLESDLINQNNAWCGVTDENEKSIIDSIDRDFGLLNSNCKILKVATDADYEFYVRNGANTNQEIQSIINLIQPVYQSTFEVLVRLVYQNVWTTSADPYTGDPLTDAGSALLVNELRNYWNANFQSVSRDVVHLFTGRGFGGDGVAGRVYEIGTICKSPDKSYGFTRERAGDYQTTAHEIGHNFGGVHSDGINCGTTSASIMCQGFKANPMYFSPASITRIGNFINSNSFCMVPERYYWIVGPDIICGTQLYSLQNNHPSDIVTWNASPNNYVQLTPVGQSVNVIPINNGVVSLTATINGACSSPITINRALTVASREPDAYAMSVQRSGPSCVGYDYQPISFGVVYDGASGCALAAKSIVEVEWQLMMHGPATPQIQYNAGGFNCSTNDVINAGITVGFGNFSQPFMITLLFRVKNKCGHWSDYSAGYSFEIRRC